MSPVNDGGRAPSAGHPADRRHTDSLTTSTPDSTENVARALAVAGSLAGAGVPIVLGDPYLDGSGALDPTRGVGGYRLPAGWQRTQADPTVLDGYRPGMAVCAVMGHGLDALDVDPRNGGEASVAELAARGLQPTVVAIQATPSGGQHALVNSLGVRSLDGFLPGLDIKAGTNGQGHGLIFLPPTVKVSKSTGRPAAYRWQAVDLSRMTGDDLSGAALAEAVAAHREAHQQTGASTGPASDGPVFADLDEARVGAYLDTTLRGEARHLAEVQDWPEGYRDEHGRGWEKIGADVANRLGRLERAPWTPPEGWAWPALQKIVPRRMADAIDLAEVWHRQRDRRDPAPFPAELGRPTVDIATMATGSPTPATSAPLVGSIASPASFFNGDGLRARALLAQVAAQGPVATSPDGEVWTYAGGVWRPGEREVRRRIGACLGDRYRKAHAETILDLIRAEEPRITDRPQPRFINFRNGMLDLETGTLAEHSPEHYSTNQLAVSWRPDATCPQILGWLGQMLPEPAEQRVWLELVGYAAYGDNPLHKAALLDGGGRNGKGTTLRLISALLGRENVAAVAPQQLDSDRWAAADLFGVLANLAGDVSPRSFKETETFKKVTGGDLIRAERKHRDAFKFVSRAFLIGSFNRLPTSADHSEGFFSRWVVLPFRAQIAEPDEHGNVPPGTIRKDPTVEQRLLAQTELEGLAVAAVRALRDLLTRGAFTETESGKAAQTEFRQHADPLRGFLAEAVSVVPGVHTTRPAMYAAYRAWCQDNNVTPRGRNIFNGDLRALHLEVFGIPADEGKTNGSDVWRGLQLAADHHPLIGASHG